MDDSIAVPRQTHPPLLNRNVPADLARLYARQEEGLQIGACEVAARRAQGEILGPLDEARAFVGAYLFHLDATEGRDVQAPETEAQLLSQIRAAAAELRISHLKRLGLDPLQDDDDMALLVAIVDADLHSLIDHQDAARQLLVVRERIYGQPEVPQ